MMKQCLYVLLFVVLGTARVQGSGFVRWSDFSQGLPLESGGIVDVALATDGSAYAVAQEGKLFRHAAESASTWKPVTGDAACLAAPCALALQPGTAGAADRLYLGVRTTGGGLWRSDDAGTSWKRIGSKDAGMASDDVASIAWPASPSKVLLVGHRAGDALSVSADGGKTWSTSAIGVELPDASVFALSEQRWVVASASKPILRWTEDGGVTWAESTGDTDYMTGALSVIRTGNTFLSAKHHGLNRSVDGGKSWKYEMGAHARVIGAVGDTLFREGDRTFLHGTQDRILNLELSGDFGAHWDRANFGLLQTVPTARRAQLIVSAEKDPFAHVRLATAWAAAPDGHSVLLALGPAGLYRGQLLWSEAGPMLLQASVEPTSLVEGDTQTPVMLRAVASSRAHKVVKVSADLSAIGLGELELLDDGQHDDGQPKDKTYGGRFTLKGKLGVGEQSIGVVAWDDQGGVSSGSATLKIVASDARLIVWNGEEQAYGQAWCGPQSPLNYFKTQTDEAHSGAVALEFRGEGSGWIGGGWNWRGWYPDGSGDDIRPFANLSFWIKIVGDDPQTLNVSLLSAITKNPTGQINVTDYIGDGVDLRDGQWHEVVIPLRDLYAAGKASFDPRSVWQLGLDSWAPEAREFSVFVDDIGFDNRPVRSHGERVTFPVAREPRVLNHPVSVTADVDIAATGTPVSPFIYGAAMGDREVANEAGLTILRAGGNPVTPINWKRGFGAKGSDWYFQNEGKETPPENHWLLAFHRENRAAGLGTYLTLPMMGRVAKDGTSVAFDIRKYADQDSWAGQSQPTDPLPNAGSGRRFVRGADGQFATGKDGKRVTELIEPDPDDTSVEVSPDEQCAMLTFMIEQMKYGKADQDGVRYLALDNEPALWNATHRGMHPRGMSYDELWQRTLDYASRLKIIDPAVRIAGPTWFGWTAYHVSGRDMELCGSGKASWTAPPDFTAHGSEPITRWWLKKLADYEREHGTRLVDILDFHFYPQNNIYMQGAPHDPKVMETRVQETRVLWDPTFVDPSWMADDLFGKPLGGKLQVLRLMHRWIDECNPGMQTALGEYNWGGDKDVSGGVAQAELLGIFAREKLDHAYLWFFPDANSPAYFAFKLLRNPDGKHTAVGDRYLDARVSAPDDVSVHAYRDEKGRRLSFVLVNKRAAKDATVTLKLPKDVPQQQVTMYEYSATDRFCIGSLPPQTLGGRTIKVGLPSMSVLRFDVNL